MNTIISTDEWCATMIINCKMGNFNYIVFVVSVLTSSVGKIKNTLGVAAEKYTILRHTRRQRGQQVSLSNNRIQI